MAQQQISGATSYSFEQPNFHRRRVFFSAGKQTPESVSSGTIGQAFAKACSDCSGQSGRMVLLINGSGDIQFCCAETARFFGKDKHAILGVSLSELLPQFSYSLFDCSGNRANPAFHYRVGNMHVARPDGQMTALEAAVRVLEGESDPLFLLELQRSPANADGSEKLLRFQEVAEWSEDAIAITDAQGVIVYVNPAFEALTGYGRNELIGATHAILKSNLHDPKLYSRMWRTLLTKRAYRGQFVNRRKNGRLFYEDKVIRPFCNAHGEITHYIARGRDVSERVKSMRKLEHLANHDGLTGLPNRTLFMDRLQQAQAYASRHNGGFALLLLDLDSFKAINDTHGHAVGDAVLQTVAKRIRKSLRAEDTVARLGGDEFALIIEKAASRRDMQPVLEKMKEQLQVPFVFKGLNLCIRVSIGIAFYPVHGRDSHDLIRHADQAMYRAKAAGGNGHVFSQDKTHCLLLTQGASFDAKAQSTTSHTD